MTKNPSISSAASRLLGELRSDCLFFSRRFALPASGGLTRASYWNQTRISPLPLRVFPLACLVGLEFTEATRLKRRLFRDV